MEEKKLVCFAVEKLRREMERGDLGFVQVGPVRPSARRARERDRGRELGRRDRRYGPPVRRSLGRAHVRRGSRRLSSSTVSRDARVGVGSVFRLGLGFCPARIVLGDPCAPLLDHVVIGLPHGRRPPAQVLDEEPDILGHDMMRVPALVD